ncbi:hypothetical protein B0H14DRAFT_2563711 [Mycena olivaceomarginata]|nr:hypothetical protein B0H14DRAFT_2563711 [Mycena olivaceomarginata]
MSDSQEKKSVNGENSTDGASTVVVVEENASDLMRVFVNYLPNNINKEGLAVEFLKSGISIRNASIHPAWNKSYLWADIVVAATDYAKALGMDNKLIFGTAIGVKPFSLRSKYQKSPQNMPHGQEMRFTADLSGVENDQADETFRQQPSKQY